jgi:hypothetical protein
MATIRLPKRLYERHLPALLGDIIAEKVRLSGEVKTNAENYWKLLRWWGERRSDVTTFGVVEAVGCTTFSDQLSGLVGENNFARYRKYRNGNLYLVPASANVHLVKMLPEIHRFKYVSNFKLFDCRRAVMGSPTTPLPWEEPNSFALEWARRLSERTRLV